MAISRIFPASNHYVNGDVPAEKPEDKNRIQREETLHKRIAKLENDVQAANDDSTAWMEVYHEQCSKNASLSREIHKASTSLGSQLTYLDLRAQISSLEIKCKSLGSDLRDSERSVAMLKIHQKQKQSTLISKISTLQGKISRQVRHGRKKVPNTVRATQLKREKAESAMLRDVIAKKDLELRAAADRMSQLKEESAQNQTSFDEVKHGLDEELIVKKHEITKLREKAAKNVSQLEARSAQNEAFFSKIKHDLDEELIEKKNEIIELREKAAKDLTISRALASNHEQQLGAKTREIERSQAALSKKRAELESLNQKVASFEARDEAMEIETLAPTPSDLAPTASEGMDIVSPEQLQLESQNETLAEQREQISDLEQSKKALSERLQSLDESANSTIEALNKEITQLNDIIDGYRHGDEDMSDAPVGVEELTESYSVTINMQKDELAKLQKENEYLKAIVGQNQSLERGGRELPDATIARLRKEKEEMSTNLQKARKLADNLKKERDQHRQAKTTITHEHSELTKSQRQNVEELKKLREEKATLVEKCAELEKLREEKATLVDNCASLQKNVELLTGGPRNPDNDRKRRGPDDEEDEAIEKRAKRDEPDSSNA